MANQHSVLITGTSTGLGKKTTEYLAENDYKVYASVRKESDLNLFDNNSNIHTVLMDVTSPEMVNNVFHLISKDKQFYGLINNAGIINVGSLVETSISDLKMIFDVNLFAPIRLIQRFHPLLYKNNGHIINISSINGFAPSPIDGGYSMTKHAMEALTEQMVVELSPHVKITSIQPALFDTAMIDKVQKQYETLADKGNEYAKEALEFYSQENILKDPVLIAKKIHEILEDDDPGLRYAVGTKEEESWMINALFNNVINTNFSKLRSEDELLNIFKSKFNDKQ